MSRLAAKENHEKRSFKPQIYKSRSQNRFFNWENFQNRPGNRNRGQDTSSRPRQTIEIVIRKETSADMEDKIVEADIEMIDIMITVEAETGQEIIIVAEMEVQVTVDPGQVPELI